MCCGHVTFLRAGDLVAGIETLMGSSAFRHTASALIVVLVMGAAMPSGWVDAAAQTEEIDALRARRDEMRSTRARAAADLDPLYAADDELEAALAILNEELANHQTVLEATRSQLRRAQHEVATSLQQVAAEQERIVSLKKELQRQALVAYVQPNSSERASVLASSDLNEGERRRALISVVSSSQSDLLDEMRLARSLVEQAASRAKRAQESIVARQQVEQQQLAKVQAAIADQQRLKSALDERIAEFQAEIDAHEADEDALTSRIVGLIAEEERRKAAEAEARRIAAERARIAAEQARLQALRDAGQLDANPNAVSRAGAALDGAPSQGVIGPVMWPVSGRVTSKFGPRWGRMHNGIDIGANTGTPVIASASGRVIHAGSEGGYGRLVLIDHGGGFVTAYAHLNTINVSRGQQVSMGSPLGSVGCTGNCTGPHLHFETRVFGVAYDPFAYLG